MTTVSFLLYLIIVVNEFFIILLPSLPQSLLLIFILKISISLFNSVHGKYFLFTCLVTFFHGAAFSQKAIYFKLSVFSTEVLIWKARFFNQNKNFILPF